MAAKRKAEAKPVEAPEAAPEAASEAKPAKVEPKAESASGAPYRVAKGKSLVLRRGVADSGQPVTLKDFGPDEAAAKLACEKMLSKGYLIKS